MAGLLLGGCVALRQGGLTGLPSSLKGAVAHEHLERTASCFVVAAACDGLATVAELAPCSSATGGGALGTVLAVSNPPRTYNHTRRITVPTYCLAGTQTRRRGRRGSGGDDEELFGGGGDDGWGGDGGFWDGGDSGDEDGGDGSLAARLQDLLLLWSFFCALAFCQTLYHVSPKPKAGLVGPAFAALSYSGIKRHLLQHQGRSQ